MEVHVYRAKGLAVMFFIAIACLEKTNLLLTTIS